MSELVVTQASMRIRAEGRVGTLCLRQPCALCGRPFDIQNGEEVLIAREADGGRIGEVCPRCAGSDEEHLKEWLAARAGRLREKTEELERWSRGGIQAPGPQVEPSAAGSRPQNSPRGRL